MPDPASTGTSARREADFFDRLVSSEGAYEPFAPGAWTTLARSLGRFLPPDAARLAVLDAGCGTGSSAQLYRPLARTYAGIDLSMSALAAARHAAPAALWLRGDAAALPWRNESFDLVAFSSVLHHMPDFSAALREAFRVLRPGGFVFAFDPNLLHPAMALLRHPRSPFYSAEGVSPNERPLLPGELRRAFQAAGFVGIRQRGQAAIPYRRLAVGRLNGLLPIYNALDRAMDLTGIGRWIGPFVLTFARRPATGAAG